MRPDILCNVYCTRCGSTNAGQAQFCHACGSPFSPATVPVTPASVVVPNVRYAGFWLRFWAYLIDNLILGIVPFLIAIIAAPLFFAGAGNLAFLGLWIFILPLFVVGGWLYYAVMESSLHQATFGKKALGLKVTGMYGERISFGTATIRYFGKILSHAVMNIGFIMDAFTEKKQALHDIL